MEVFTVKSNPGGFEKGTQKPTCKKGPKYGRYQLRSFARLLTEQMEPMQYKNLLKQDDSLGEFEFLDDEGDLDIDLTKSSIDGGTRSPVCGLISTLCKIVEEQGLITAIPVNAVASTAVGAVTGSLIGGPSGLAIGLITGAIIAYRASPTRSKTSNSEPSKTSIRQIFKQMTLQQKRDLIRELLGCLKESGTRNLILDILKNESVRKMALDILSSFLMKRMGISLLKPT